MAEYEQQMTIQASADAIFDFVADVQNLPKYLPTTKSAQSQGKDRVRIQGGGEGFQYDSDGFLRADHTNYRLDWGADERYYSGYLQIEPNGEASEVTVHISFRGTPPGGDSDGKPSDENIEEGLHAALVSIRNYLTGQGGKEEPSVARPD